MHRQIIKITLMVIIGVKQFVLIYINNFCANILVYNLKLVMYFIVMTEVNYKPLIAYIAINFINIIVKQLKYFAVIWNLLEY